jgi:hypothetical protein
MRTTLYLPEQAVLPAQPYKILNREHCVPGGSW